MDNAIIGLKKLLNNDFSSFTYANDIKLYALIMVFCNNMDSLFGSIPDYLLEDIFNMHQIEKSKAFLNDKSIKYYDYGLGYKSNYRGDLHDELRLLRNSLSHGDFKVKKDIVEINKTSYEARFDIKWLEALVLIALANNNYNLEINMSDIMLLCLVNPLMYKSSDIRALANDGKVVFIKLTAKISDQEKILKLLNAKGIKKERLTFDLLKSAFMSEVQSVLNQLIKNSNVLKSSLNYALSLVEKRFEGIIKTEVVKIDDELLSDPFLYNLNSNMYLQYIIDSEIKKERFKKNIIDLTNFINILNKLNEGKTLDQNDLVIFESLKEFLIRLYGYMVFNIMDLTNGDQEIIDEYLISKKLEFDMGHASNIWKEYLKRIKKSIEVLKIYDDKYKEMDILYTLLNLYLKKLDIIANGKERILLTSSIRNALTHDYIKIDGENILLYDKEPEITLWKTKSKTGKFESSSFSKREHIFNAKINVGDYLSMLDFITEEKIDDLKR